MFNNKIILITGGTGSWGNELTKQLLTKYSPKEIRIYSRGEHKQVTMKITFQNEERIKYLIGDVRDKGRLDIAMRNVDYVFHLAALKHVPVCEENPWESVLTNINGTRNVIEAAINNKVKKVIDISTDKAVDPLNLYGVCKSVGEKLIIAANLESNDTSFVCIRAGNVLGTNGSVVPLFKEQILTNNEVTITEETMTRYFLTLHDAVNLIFKASQDSVGGEVFVMKMPSARIIELAEVMTKLLGNKETKIRKIGIRPGEKIRETLVSQHESSRTIEEEDYYVILPMLKMPKINQKYSNYHRISIQEFNSENTHVMDKKEIEHLLRKGGFLSSKGDAEKYFDKKLSSQELKDVFKIQGWQKNGFLQKNKKILVLGSKGMLGHMVASYLNSTQNYLVTSIDKEELDAESSEEKIGKIISAYSPDVVINCMGLINKYANEPAMINKAFIINSDFPHKLYSISVKDNWKLIHISSDCYLDEDVYGRSKKKGEIDHENSLTIRTSIIGPELKDGQGLFNWFMNQTGQVSGYVNAIWDGVTTLQLSKFIQECIEDDKIHGIMDYRNKEPISKHDLIKQIAKVFGKNIEVKEDLRLMKDKRNLKADVFCQKSYLEQLKELKAYMQDNKESYLKYLK